MSVKNFFIPEQTHVKGNHAHPSSTLQRFLQLVCINHLLISSYAAI